MEKQKLQIGDLIEFETFKNPKTKVKGEIVRIFTSTKDNKEYCQIKVGNKIYSKQTSKI